jgi:GcrA cell cycle regulator
MQLINWPPEHSEALRDYLSKGMSYSRIAQAINARFSTCYTRNAAIGRAKRMGLVGIVRPDGWTQPLMKTSQPNLRRLRERFEAEFRKRTPIFETIELKLRCAEVDPLHLSLLELKPRDCRYPYGGDSEGEAITFCGHRRQTGSSYCAPHFRLSRGERATSERTTEVRSRLVEAA